MKTRSLSTATRTIGLICLLVLASILAYGSTQAGVGNSPEWVNFFSANTTFLGQPVPVGAMIAAFDPQGVQCGATPVAEEGKYGLMPCYRDDPDTPDEDEGPQPGEPISFKINGLPATPVPISLNGTPVAPSTTITWTEFGDRWEVDLQVPPTPTPTPTPTATPTNTPTPIPVGGVIVPLSRLELLGPWLGLAALIVATIATVMVMIGSKGVGSRE
jgi:hypothetical protein